MSKGFSQLARRSRLTDPNQPREVLEDSRPEQAPSERNRPSSSPHACSLPAEDELIRLLERFFTTIGAVIPCIDEAALLEYWTGFSKDKTRLIPRTAYALVNIIMAHASATMLDGNPILYYRRSLDLLDMQTVQRTDIYTGRLLARFRLQRLAYG